MNVKETTCDYIRYLELEGNEAEIRNFIEEYENYYGDENYVRYTFSESRKKAWIWRTLDESEKLLNKFRLESSKGHEAQFRANSGGNDVGNKRKIS